MKTRRISLAKASACMLPLAYLGLAAPGWAIAHKYVPPSNEIASPTHSVEVERGHLIDEWTVSATVSWTDTDFVSASGEGQTVLEPGAELQNGSPIAVSRNKALFSLACDAMPVEVHGSESGGEFLSCVQRMLSSAGYSISETDLSTATLGASTQQALKAFYEDNQSQVPWDDGTWQRDATLIQEELEEAIEEADSINIEGYRILTNLSKKQAAEAVVESLETQIDRIKRKRGPILSANDWYLTSPDQAVTFVGVSEDKFEFGIGDSVARSTIAIDAAEAGDLEVSSELFDELSISEFGEELINSETGMAEVEVTVVGIDGLGLKPGDSIDLSFSANDSGEEVLYAPAGVVQNSDSGFFIQRVNTDGAYESIRIPEPNIVSNKVVLEELDGVTEDTQLRVV